MKYSQYEKSCFDTSLKGRIQRALNGDRVEKRDYTKKIFFTTVKQDNGVFGTWHFLVFYDNHRFLQFEPTAYQLEKAKSYKKGFIGYSEKAASTGISKCFAVVPMSRAHATPMELNKAMIASLIETGLAIPVR